MSGAAHAETLAEAWRLLAEVGFVVPRGIRVEVGTRKARWLGWWMARFDAPPLAVTLGSTVYFPDAAAYARLSPRARAALLAHEAVHVVQWRRLGGWRFVWQYVREYLRTRREGVGTHDPQQGIALEREAIRVEQAVAARLAEASLAESKKPEPV